MCTERYFLVLNKIENALRTTMCRDRLSSLEMLTVDIELAKIPTWTVLFMSFF